MEIWVTFRLPIKLAAGRIVETHGEGSMMTTRLPRSIDEVFGARCITDHHVSWHLGLLFLIKICWNVRKRFRPAPEVRALGSRNSGKCQRYRRLTCMLCS